MNERLEQTFAEIKAAMDSAPRRDKTAEMFLQIIKHYDRLRNLKGREFTEGIGEERSKHAEFSKVKKIVPRLIAAGLKPERI